MLSLKALLHKTSSFKSLITLFITSHLVSLLMMIFTFPEINNQIGTKAFDLQPFGYTLLEANSIINNLNDKTTAMYLFPQLSFFDLLYPILLALFLSSFLFRLMNITKSNNRVSSILLIPPFLAMMFDYFENLCIILMITKSLVPSENFVLLSSIFTILKGVLTSFSWISISYYSIKWFWKKLNKNDT
mgnify:CR=1 FL=1